MWHCDMSFLEQFRFPCKYNSTNTPHSFYYLFIYQKKNRRKPGTFKTKQLWIENYEGWNFNSGNYLFTTDTK